MIQSHPTFDTDKQKTGHTILVRFTGILLTHFLSMWHLLPAWSYGVLAHEAIVDAMWEESIKHLLKQKFPKASAEELTKAHAYAYGGAIIPDIGYYPMGRPLFSRLVHYVRAGDFVMAMQAMKKDPGHLQP